MKLSLKSSLLLSLFFALPAVAQQSGTAPREKTTFQTAGQWKPVTDVRADVVMVYGANDRRGLTFRQRVDSWREHGYTAHFMTGIAWGDYQDYFTGNWDGRQHLDEGQKTMQGDTIWHGHMVPYIVPTRHYLEYFKQRHINPVINAGIDAIFLEEPEFWALSGYSEAFKREWQEYYGFAWRPQHESAENTYLSNKLKYHLYYRALDECFTHAKAYGREKGLDVRCYVPTHSLLNYSQWSIVSPEASLASLPSVDGYIAQVWTGTSREPNYYNGRARERIFETAFLEYGSMQSMTAPTGRKMFFLTDPIEDRAKDWDDYKRGYEATFTAQLLYPDIADYEIMPWPDRIYEGLYRVSAESDERAHIPRFYSTQMQLMVNALDRMPTTENTLGGTSGVRVVMANSLMFQRAPHQVEGYDDPQLSNFYGLALPLLKTGIPVGIMHLENTSYEASWQGAKVVLMSYAAMKPLSADCHTDIAHWIRQGGHLVYCCRDDDAFQTVQEWWNQGGLSFRCPFDHLLSLLSLPAGAEAGEYSVGDGRLTIIRQDPKEFALSDQGHAPLLAAVNEALKKQGERIEAKNYFLLERGAYTVASVVDESPAGSSPLTLRGRFIDIFDPQLPVLTEKIILPGRQALLLNIDRIPNKKTPQVLASASRQYDERLTRHSYSFRTVAPANTTNAMRILLPKRPKRVAIDGKATSDWTWDSGTLFIQHENRPWPEGVLIDIKY